MADEAIDIDRNVYTLAYVVDSCLADINETEGMRFMQFLKWAIDGYRKLNLSSLLPNIKSVMLDVDPSTNTAKLPIDFIDYTKIGLCVNGVILNLDMHDELCLHDYATSVCGCTDSDINTAIENVNSNVIGSGGYAWVGDTWFYPYYQHYHNGQFTAGYYGLGAGFGKTGYRINRELNCIQLNSNIQSGKILLEYKSSGLDATGNAIVPQTALLALQAWVHYRRLTFSTDRNDKMQAELFRRQFVNEGGNMALRQSALSKAEWVQLFRRFNYQTPKR